MKAFAKSWWPIPVMLASVIAVQVLWTGHQDHSAGHASGHFSSATVVFGVAFCIAVLVWALPSHARRRGELWLFVVAILTGALTMNEVDGVVRMPGDAASSGCSSFRSSQVRSSS